MNQLVNLKIIPEAVGMTVEEFNAWYQTNREAVDQLNTRYTNNRIAVIVSKGKEYKFIRWKSQGQLVLRGPKYVSETILWEELEDLKRLAKEIKFGQDRIRDMGNLLISLDQQTESWKHKWKENFTRKNQHG